MKKTMTILLIFVSGFALVSCDLFKEKVASVVFTESKTKAFSGSVNLIDADSLKWTVSLTKIDDGDKVGECEHTFTTIGLSDKSIKGLSLGKWRFSFVGKNGDKAVYQSTVEKTVVAGENTVDITLQTVGDKGTLNFSSIKLDSEFYTDTLTLIVKDVTLNKTIRNMSVSSGDITLKDGVVEITPFQTDWFSGKDLYSFELAIDGTVEKTYQCYITIYGGMTTTVSLYDVKGSSGFVITLPSSEVVEEITE